MSIQERIQMIIKMHNLSSSAFADQIGVQRSNVSHVLSGRNKPSLDFLEKIVSTFPRVNAHWLLTGVMSVKHSEIVPEEELHLNEIARDEGKNVERIVTFYNDGTCDIHLPNVG